MATTNQYELGAFSETALIEICPLGGDPKNYASLVETIDIDEGDKDMEQIVTLSGGRLYKKIPQAETTITFEGYPIGTDPAYGPSQFFAGITNTVYDTAAAVQNYATRNRNLFRVTILWTTDTTCTTAGGNISTGTNGYRYSVAHCLMTSCKKSFTDGVLKFTFSFKVPAFNKNGISHILEESTPDAAGGTTTGYHLMTYNSTNFPEEATTNFSWSSTTTT